MEWIENPIDSVFSTTSPGICELCGVHTTCECKGAGSCNQKAPPK